MADAESLTVEQYRSIASFRHQLRRFMAFSEAAAAAVGLPVQQHQALLAIAGHGGRGAPSVGTLAEQLIIAPHTAAELVARMVEAGLVTKAVSARDRRRQELTLTARAAALLASLTAAHRDELMKLRDVLMLAVASAEPRHAPGEQGDAPGASRRPAVVGDEQ